MPAQPADPALGSQLIDNHRVTEGRVLLHAGFCSPKQPLSGVLSVSRQCSFTGDCNCRCTGSGDVSGLLKKLFC